MKWREGRGVEGERERGEGRVGGRDGWRDGGMEGERMGVKGVEGGMYVCMYIEFMTRHMSQAIRLCGKNTSQLTVSNTEKNVSLTVFYMEGERGGKGWREGRRDRRTDGQIDR